MNRISGKALMVALGVLASGMLAGPMAAHAQDPASSSATDSFFQPGSILVRGRAAAVIPENLSSSISVIGGHVDATTAYIPEVDLSYFLTSNWSVEAIAGTSKHEVSAGGSALGNKADVGSVWVLPPTVTLQYHHQFGNFIPYGGAGLTVMFFYDSQSNKSAGINKVKYDTGVGPAIDFGFDYVLTPRWVANFDVKQTFVETTAHINGTIDAKTSISPTIVALGLGYRF